MTEIEPDLKEKRRDRRLGDEWADWNGTSDPSELDIDEKLRTFLALAGGALLIILAALELGWYLAKPRIEQLSPFLSHLIGWSALVVAVFLLLLVSFETTLVIVFKRSLFPYPLAGRLLLSLLSKSMWLGQKFGISRDRVGNSFIKAHNLMLKTHAGALRGDVLLVLLPRCLEKETKRQVIERVNGRAVQIVTAGGGEEARRAIRQYNPSLILAVACERDLISGIKDLAERIPVLAIPNKRPEGPCKNTHLQLDELDDVLNFIIRRTGSIATPEPTT